MKLWTCFLIALLCAFIAVGYCDVGFGHDVIIEDEEEEPDQVNLSLVDEHISPSEHVLSVEQSETHTTRGSKEGVESSVLPLETEEVVESSVLPVEMEEVIELSVERVEAEEVVEPSVLSVEAEKVVESSALSMEAISDGVDLTLVDEAIMQNDGVVAIDDSTSSNCSSVAAPVTSSESSTAPELESTHNDGLPLLNVVVSEKGMLESDTPLNRVEIPAVDSITADAISFDSEFSMGGGAEALLDQLDEATQEIATLTAANAALKESLSASSEEARTLGNEVNALRGKLAALYTALTAVQSESQNRANVSSEQWSLQTKQHAEEVKLLADRLTAAERNATTLEIRARLEKNEKIIARLSTDNCLLELEAARHLQQDALAELRAEITALKKLGDAKCSVSSAGMSSTPSVAARAAASAPVSSAKRDAASGDCDTTQCLDSLLSKYVFFWASEHQSDISTSKSPPPQSRAASTAPVAPTASELRSSPPVKLGRSDADLDRIGDEEQGESTPMVLLQLLQRVAASIWSASATHVYPLAFRLLKYEFRIAAVVVKTGYEAAVWLWSSVLSPVFFNAVMPTAKNVYYTQILPFVNSTVYPWYKVNLEEAVDTRLAAASAHWIEHYDEWFGYHIADPFEFVVGRLYVGAYFVEKFFSSDALAEQLEHVGQYAAGFVPSVIHQLSSIGALQSYFGEHCVTVVSMLVYSSVGLFLYLTRRVVLGIVAFAAVILLSPLLFAIYVFAKVVAMFRPRKKTKRGAVGNGRPSRSTHNGQHRDREGSGQHRERDGGGHSSQPPQLATQQLPVDIPVTGAASVGRESSRSVGASSIGATARAPQTSRSGASAPPVSRNTSGLPPRQGYPRGDLSRGGSGSNSGESLSKLGAPPLGGAWASAEPEV